MINKFASDYLVVGAGAMGMAFTDVLIAETDATVTIVDRHARPGGHWNDSYPFVRLHQPSSFYGVNSRNLGSDTKDFAGWNAGLYELASGTVTVKNLVERGQETIALDDVEEAFAKMERGEVLRSVVTF